ncbi:MAG: prepilin peptidase [Rhodospirillaceae bacterium]|nr:prepilin peptidase [Rhodospirillaceae bacterium]
MPFASLPHESAAAVALMAAIGLIVGSFVTALSYRLPRGLNFVAGRSRCPACGTALGAADLVPVLSWVFARGRCRHCRAPVAWRYPAIEAVTALMFVGAALLAPAWPQSALLAGIAAVLIAVAVIDLEHGRIPNGLVLGLALLMVGWRAAAGASPGDLAASLGMGAAAWAGLTAVRAAIAAVTRQQVLGAGDAKLMAAAAIGLPLWPFVVCLGLAGGFAVLFGLAWQAAGRGRQFPFAPSLAAALWLTLAVPGLSGWLGG